MEKALLKLARQLNAYDEASLMSLWEKYSEAVQRFEPSKRWEEAVLVLSMIQGMRFKNQLFNHHWAAGREVGGDGKPPQMPSHLSPQLSPQLSSESGPHLVPSPGADIPARPSGAPAPAPSAAPTPGAGSAGPAGGNGGAKRGKLLHLTPRED